MGEEVQRGAPARRERVRQEKAGKKSVSKTPETLDLEARLLRYTSGQFGCDEVTIGPAGCERVDYITVDFKGVWRCYEIKVSKSDFRSKTRKTFVGNLNYYVMPQPLYEAVKAEVPAHVGVLVPIGPYLCLESRKKAVRQAIGADEKLLTASLIRSLYRTYERVKLSGHEPVILDYKRRIARLEELIEDHRKDELEDRTELWAMQRFLRKRGLYKEYQAEQDGA